MAYTQLIEQQENLFANNNSNLILSQFSSIYNSPDIQASLCEIWPTIVKQSAKNKKPLDTQDLVNEKL